MERARRQGESIMIRCSTDRISNLTDDLLLHILGFLETIVVVQTCVLSRRWRNLWTRVPVLRFIYPKFTGNPDSFLRFIFHVLLRRQQYLDVVKVRFHQKEFCIHYDESQLEFVTTQLMHYAAHHKVQELELHTDFDIAFPTSLFHCQSLRALELNLDFRHIRLPRYLGNLTALKSLTLVDITLNATLHGSTLSSCPNLETLKLVEPALCGGAGTFHIQNPNLRTLEYFSSYGDDDDVYEKEFGDEFKLVISAPKLNTFKFCAYLPIALCFMDDCSSLEHVSVDLHPLFAYHDCGDDRIILHAIKMLNQFRNARFITLSLQTIKVLSVSPSLLDEHRSMFAKLECLKLEKKEAAGGQDHHVISFPPSVLNYFLNGSSGLRLCL